MVYCGNVARNSLIIYRIKEKYKINNEGGCGKIKPC